jgi:signal transduction histidine kinase
MTSAQAASGDTQHGVMAPGPPRAPRPPRPPGAFKRDARRVLRLFVREPFTRRTWRECLYAGLNLLLAIPFFAFTVVAVTVGLALSVSFAGLPLLAASLRTVRRLGAVCRRTASRAPRLRRAEPPPPFPLRPVPRIEPPPAPRSQPGRLGWIWSGLTDPVSWRACGYLLLKLPVAVLGGIGLGYILAWGVGYTTLPLWWELIHQLAAHGVMVQVPGWLAWWKPDPVLVAQSVPSLAWSFALVPAGAITLGWAPLMIRGVNDWDRILAAKLLGPPLTQRMRDLEETRASAVDDSAARLRRIERDLHDGAQAQMVAVAMKLGLAREKLGGVVSGNGVASGTGVARGNGMAGRTGVAGGSEVADGGSMASGTREASGSGVAGVSEMASGTGVAGGSESGWTADIDLERVLELVDAAHRSAKEAIIELRDLARGIHPPVLDHGLGTALTTLAARSAVPVEVVVDLPERPSAAIETIAYFCAAELLANVAKHSAARHATLEAVHVPGLLRVRVGDDGNGGARVTAGSGLAGLAERLRTVDGIMEISSPRGGPTVITIELPSHA